MIADSNTLAVGTWYLSALGVTSIVSIGRFIIPCVVLFLLPFYSYLSHLRVECNAPPRDTVLVCIVLLQGRAITIFLHHSIECNATCV